MQIKKPMNSGSTYFNYKKTFSSVLMAVSAADYSFLYVEVGINGRISDGGVWRDCAFNKKIENGQLNLPVRGAGDNPFVFVADAAFPLKPYLMKPFPRRDLADRTRIYNYRLSRARRVVENSFGILANRFRCLLKLLELRPNSVKLVCLACCVLHNLLIKTNSKEYLTPNLIDRDATDGSIISGDWRSGNLMCPLRAGRESNSTTLESQAIRNYFVDYFSGPGAVSFQYRVLELDEPNVIEDVEMNELE